MSDDLWNSIVGDGDDPPGDGENEKLAPLIDEIDLIQDPGIASFVRAMLLRADVFWKIPSSFSGHHHPPDEHGEGGNVLHTKRVVRIVKYLAEAQERDQFETDQLIAAAILHDLTKGVVWGEGNVGYDPLHPITVDRFYQMVRNENRSGGDDQASTTLDIEDEVVYSILRMVRCSHGRWGAIPEVMPITLFESTLHWADYLSANLHYIIDKEPDESRWLPDQR